MRRYRSNDWLLQAGMPELYWKERALRLYIIGPVSGHENDNVDAFEEARDRLKAAGHKATIPHEKIPAGTPWRQAMRMSIRELLSLWKGEPRYEGVAELPGVFTSKGA